MLEKLRQLFTPEPDMDLVMAYRYKLPDSIYVEVNKVDGFYIAKIEKINNEELDKTTFMVEADDVHKLVEEVNDMLLEYLDFPESVKSKMPPLIPNEPEFREKIEKSSSKFAGTELLFVK